MLTLVCSLPNSKVTKDVPPACVHRRPLSNIQWQNPVQPKRGFICVHLPECVTGLYTLIVTATKTVTCMAQLSSFFFNGDQIHRLIKCFYYMLELALELEQIW